MKYKNNYDITDAFENMVECLEQFNNNIKLWKIGRDLLK